VITRVWMFITLKTLKCIVNIPKKYQSMRPYITNKYDMIKCVKKTAVYLYSFNIILYIFNRSFIEHVSCDCGTNNNTLIYGLWVPEPVHVNNNIFFKMFFEI